MSLELKNNPLEPPIDESQSIYVVRGDRRFVYRQANSNNSIPPPPVRNESNLATVLGYLCCFNKIEPPLDIEYDQEFRADSYINLSNGQTAYRYIEPANIPKETAENLPLVVCLHGLFNCSYMWSDLTNLLVNAEDGPKCRVLVFDFYGHGRTPWTGSPCTLDAYVNQTKELLEALGFAYQQVALIGYDLGGGVAAGFSAKFPSLTLSLTLIAPLGFHCKFPENHNLYKQRYLGEIMMMQNKNLFVEGSIKNFFNKSSDSPTYPMIELEKNMVTWQIRNTPGYLGALLSTLRLFPVGGMSELFVAIGRHSRPVLILWGERDVVTPYRKCIEDINDCMPNANIVDILETGHHVLVEKFGEVATEILAFQKVSFENFIEESSKKETK